MVVTKVSHHQVAPHRGYFFDTNVWMYIFGPIAGIREKKQSAYSNLLREIISHKASIHVSSLVLSEYINAVLHMGFNQWKRTTDNINANFKRDYRVTPEYKDTLADAIQQVQAILQVCQKRPDDFNIIDINSILASMNQNADYNDAYYLHDCERIGLILVSDDADMQNMNSTITLITA